MATPEHDPITVASARMYARGISGPDRMAALKLLGVLLDHAQHDGSVTFDADVLAAELAAGINEAHRYYRWLESTGVLSREADGWRIEGYTPALSRVDNTAAMDVLAKHLDRERRPAPAAADANPASGGVPARPSPVVVPIDAGRRRLALPALAGVAAAAAIVWVVALVNTAAGPTATQVAIEQPLAQAATRQPGTIMLAAPTPVAKGSAGARAQDSDAGAAVGAARPATPGALASCAATKPRLRVDRVDVVSADQAEGELRSGWVVLVSGTLQNAGAAPVEVRSFDIDVIIGEDTLTTSGLQAPVMLPAGTASPWTTILYAGRDQPSAPKAQPALRDWSHTGPASC